MNILPGAMRHQLARTAGIVLLISPSLLYAANGPEPDPPEPDIPTVLILEVAPDEIDKVDNTAIQAAVADGITTGLALSSGAVEANPLLSTTPLGLLALTGAKIALVKYAETLPEQDKRMVIKLSSSLWGGAAVNNLLVLFAAPTPVSILAGLLMGVFTWRHTGEAYEAADRAIAARALPVPTLDIPAVAETVALTPIP